MTRSVGCAGCLRSWTASCPAGPTFLHARRRACWARCAQAVAGLVARGWVVVGHSWARPARCPMLACHVGAHCACRTRHLCMFSCSACSGVPIGNCACYEISGLCRVRADVRLHVLLLVIVYLGRTHPVQYLCTYTCQTQSCLSKSCACKDAIFHPHRGAKKMRCSPYVFRVKFDRSGVLKGGLYDVQRSL